MRFETVQIHFLSDVFGLLSSRNFATMATWHNDFSSLYLYRAGRLFLAGYKSLKKKKFELSYIFKWILKVSIWTSYWKAKLKAVFAF